MPALRIAILPSARLAVLLGILHLAAAGLACWVPLPVWPKAVFVIVVAWRLRSCLDEVALLRAPGAIVTVQVTGEGRVIAYTRGGARLECELLPSSVVSYGLTILNLRTAKARRPRHVVACCGNVDCDDLRRLRVWLRWAAGTR